MSNPLLEQEKLKSLELVGKYGTKWKLISPGRTAIKKMEQYSANFGYPI